MTAVRLQDTVDSVIVRVADLVLHVVALAEDLRQVVLAAVVVQVDSAVRPAAEAQDLLAEEVVLPAAAVQDEDIEIVRKEAF